MYCDPFQRYQAKAPDPIPIRDEAFYKISGTDVYWLTGAGILVNSRGTTIMMDPIISLRSFDPPISEVIEHGRDVIPQYTMPPILAKDVNKLDAVLITHADPDHLGFMSVIDLLPSGAEYHGTRYVAEKLYDYGVPTERIIGHDTGDCFEINDISVVMTPAHHPVPQYKGDRIDYIYSDDDCCGFKLYTADGVIWNSGDSEFLDEHLNNTDADLVFLDMSKNSTYHLSREDAVLIADTLTNATIVMYHWGTYYSPDFAFTNADPREVKDMIKDKSRWIEPAPGEKIILRNNRT